MDDEVRIQALDPYFSTKTMGGQKGLGLGLSITHNLIEDAGGSIDIQSSSKGTTFTIGFPVFSELENPRGAGGEP